MIIGFVIWSAVAAMMLFIGLYARRAQKPVTFFTGQDTPKVSDVRGYNRAVSRLWFIYAAALEVIGLPLLTAKQNDLTVVFIIPGMMIASIALMVAYVRVERRYTEKK